MSVELLRRAAKVIQETPEETYAIVQTILREDPDNAAALYMLGTVLSMTERHGEAIPVLERAAKLAPKRNSAWNNLGLAWQECGRSDIARGHFQKALGMERTAQYLSNIGVTYMNEGNFAEAIRWSNRALEMEPGHVSATSNKGFAMMASGDWAGWRLYDKSLGGRFRKEMDFGAPKWEGQPVESIVIYGEQGLGDEIAYASILADVPATLITLECDPRLESLFRRSFPEIEVHGTRKLEKPWMDGTRWWHAQSAIGSLPSYLRPTIESCPKKPYLVADPERRVMWRALFDSFKYSGGMVKPVIGLCWSGGTVNTGRKKRRIGLESFRGYIEANDAYYVSLQYEDAGQEIAETGLPVRQFHEVLSDNYDDTAALVAELDTIIGVHTTVHHLAGAMGKATTVLVPEAASWQYAHGDAMPWYQSNRYHRQRKSESWADCIGRLTKA